MKTIKTKKPVILIIRDGWGKGKGDHWDAISSGKTPNTDYFENNYPTTLIKTSGRAVGLPQGYQGNSEVGHLNIGAGRVVYQSLTRIDKSVEDGEFQKNKSFLKAIENAKKNKTTLHLMGLIQDQGVHAITRHCISLLEVCKANNFSNVVVHVITDGRDTPPKSTLKYIKVLDSAIKKIGVGKIVSLIGRYYTMDRDTNWKRTEVSYRALVEGKILNEKTKTYEKCTKYYKNYEEAVEDAYKNNETDEFIKPRLIGDYQGFQNNDSFIFFNFRFDRTRQITKAFVEKDFNSFKRPDNLNLFFVAMTHYYDNGNFIEAFPELKNSNILGEVISQNGLHQLRCSETEKFAHVTFFFNSLSNNPSKNEDHILIPSPKVATYDLQPEMSAYKIADTLVENIEKKKYDLIVTNFANGDMVGHTGVYPAIIKAVKVVDECVDKVVKAILKQNGVAIIFADHGNADQTKLDDGKTPMTAHTTNPVPVTIVGLDEKDAKLREGGSLCDIAPTALHIMGIQQPKEMTGKSLII